MTPDAVLIALLAIREQIAACRKQEGVSPWLIVATLRQKAGDLATAFVDPQEETE